MRRMRILHNCTLIFHTSLAFAAAMDLARTKVALSAVSLLLLLLGQSLAMAPGDEDDVCGVPEYPVHFRVLMDSWRYQRLLPPESGDTAPWTTNRWASHGLCNSSSVSLCAKGNKENKWIQTQFIDKSLPTPDTYPVRIFVDVTYLYNCNKRHCLGNLELLVAHEGSDQYTGDGIAPNNMITSGIRTLSGTRQFSFLSNNTSSGFSLRLRATEACVTISRVLVYRYECAGHERLPTGLSRRPPTQAPDNGSVRVNPYCADHSHFPAASVEDTLVCLSNGTWLNEQPRCVCDEEYSNEEDVDTCKAQYLSPSSTPLAGGSTDRPTVAAEDSGGSGPLLPIVAGVCGFIVTILVLVLVVVVLIVALLRKKRKSGPEESSSSDKQLSNPVYDAMAQNIEVKVPAGTTSNGNGTTRHTQDEEETLHDFSNPLYHTGSNGAHSNGKSDSHHTSRNGNTYFEEPQYSVPSGNGAALAEYEMPVTSPSTTESPPPLPHVYDYASVPPSVVPEYATLEPPVHAYHTLDFSIPTNGSVAAVSGETGREGEPAEDKGQPDDCDHEYSTIGQK